jgi:phage-related protein
MSEASLRKIKPVVWIGGSKGDLVAFPEEVVSAIGYALYEAQKGNKHPNAKPLHGFGGAGVLEVVEDYDGNTYRAVYTVRLGGRVYVLHAFQKKSKKGAKTPKAEIDLLKARLKWASELHTAWLEAQKGDGDDG